MREAICLLIGYLFGCLLTAVAVTKRITGKSVFEIGSGNPGMANVMANVGPSAGIAVLLGDILKTIFALAAGYFLFRNSLGEKSLLWTGLGTAVGHNYPFWHQFKGGKGVTVTLTLLIAVFPAWGCAASLIGGLITLLSGDLWLGAVLIPLFCLPAAYLHSGMEYTVVVLLLLIMALQKNLPGIIKVAKGEEYRRFRRK